MSFILDALKKSESDRQRQRAPDISDVPTGTGKSSAPRWMWMLLALLGVNVVVLTAFLFRPAQVSNAIGVTQTPDSRIESQQMGKSMREPKAAIGQEETLPVTQQENPVRQAEPAPEAVLPKPVVKRSAPTSTTYLTFNDLRASGNLDLPDLNIDIHVYSEKPADRFVFINMNQYRENTTLVEGPLLREITTEGVILEFVGATFLLPRE